VVVMLVVMLVVLALMSRQDFNHVPTMPIKTRTLDNSNPLRRPLDKTPPRRP
jgi:hypothetical protein